MVFQQFLSGLTLRKGGRALSPRRWGSVPLAGLAVLASGGPLCQSLSAAPLVASTAPSPTAPLLTPPPRVPPNADYILGPGDTLDVVVLNHPELSGNSLIVSAGGRIQLPVVGEMMVQGQTMAWVRTTALVSLRHWLKDPVVTVNLRLPRPLLGLSVYVDGLVRTPGQVQLEEGSGVVQALAQAGGLTVPLDGERVVGSLRRGKSVTRIDVGQLALSPEANLPLRRGDVLLFVEPPIIRVQVTGPVGKPGELRLPPETTVIEAIADAGGLLGERDSADIAVLRTMTDGSRHTLNLDSDKLFSLSDLSQNVVLKDGDLVSISRRLTQSVTVGGEVKTPGSYPFKTGDDVVALLNRAGGATPWAALSHLTVTHRDGTLETVDALQAVNAGGPAGTLKLRDGDYLVAPRLENRVLVMQAVRTPGYYPIPEGKVLSLGEALSAAGGPQIRANLNDILLLRRSGDKIARTSLRLNQSKAGKLVADTPLQGGDVIFVPDGKLSVSPLSQLATATAIFGRFFTF